MLEPSPFISDVAAYVPPPFGHEVDLRLDGNEGRPPPAKILEEVARAGPEIARRYPDARPLEAAVAGRIGVGADRVLVTAGGDDAIERALRAMLAPGRRIVLPEPTFEMIGRYASLTGCGIDSVQWRRGPYPVDGVLGSVTDATRVVVVVTPNSPTGLVATRDDIARLSAGAPGALVLVDLAYVEFADEDPTGFALGLPNALVVRSMSKAWGLAGLRVGWAAGPAGVIAWMRAAGHPYAVSGPSLVMARARLESGAGDVASLVGRVRGEREALRARLEALGVAVLPSQANFVLARFGDAPAVREALARRGIAVRIFPGRPELEGCLRITLPGFAEGYARLESALVDALGKEQT